MTIAKLSTLELIGLDGGNLLAFMAAIGTFRSLSIAWPDSIVRLHWEPRGSWRPTLSADRQLDIDIVLNALDVQLKTMSNHAALAIDDNLKLPPQQFHAYALDAVLYAHKMADRTWADFIGAFGTDALAEDNVIQDTAFRTMSGAGHQHFLKTMRDLVELTERSHVRAALFEQWNYADNRPSLRWDPSDDRRYALRWKEPSSDPIRTVRGANRLAIEALPLFPTAPVNSTLETTGFQTGGSRNTFFTWPIWNKPLPLSIVGSMLALAALQQIELNRTELYEIGIVNVYRSQRLTIGKFRNFAPAQSM